MSIKKDILWRVGLIYISVFGFAVLVAAKVVYLQFINDDEYKAIAQETRIKNLEIEPHRGDILASDMRLLASSVPYYEVRMDFKAPALKRNNFFLENVDSLAWSLSRLFNDKSSADYKAELMAAWNAGKRYYPIKKKVNYLELKELKTFPIFRKGRYGGGVQFVQENVRRRPHNDLAARTIGYTSKSTRGNIVGIEGAYDTYLAGRTGLKRMQKIAGNDWMPVDGENEVEPKDGSSVVTTIDIDLQDVAEKALKRQLELHQAHHGTAVLMEVATGEVKAIANLTLVNGRYKEVYNYAIGESTEPGSTFKLPALMAALEDGYVDIDDSIDTENGRIKYYDLQITDESYYDGGYGEISVKEVFEKSSNVGMAKIITSSYRNDPHRFIQRLYGMGLNDKLGIEILGEGQPLIRNPGDELWSGVSLASMSYGYEVQLTPLQILAFYNAIANNGVLVKPKFVKEIRHHGKLEKTYPTEILNPSICSKNTLKMARELMVGVVEEGTARNLKNSHLKIAGKTGTTQIHNKKYGYKMGANMSYQASFCGYFPAHNPKFSCIVVVNSPSGSVYYGNQVAGPVFLEIANKVYATSIELQAAVNSEGSTLQIPYSKNGYKSQIEHVLKSLHIPFEETPEAKTWVLTNKKDDRIELTEKKTIENLMPNLVSMGLKDALFLLENMGLEVTVKGRGSIRKQSIPVGSRVKEGDKVSLELSFIES